MKTAIPAMLLLCARAACAAPVLPQADAVYFAGGPSAAAPLYYKLLSTDISTTAYLNAAYVARETGDTDKAAEILDSALSSYGDNVPLLDYAASFYLSVREYERARDTIENRFKVQNSVRALDYVNLARAFMGLRDFAAAEKNLKAAIAKDQRFAIAHYLLGKVYESGHRPADAAKAYDAALKADSQFIEARRDLANILFSEDKYDDAWLNYTKVSYAFADEPMAKKRLPELASKITKKPEEIMPPKVIVKNTKVRAIAAAGSPRLRVGISSDMSGAPTVKTTVSFTPQNQFLLSDPATHKKIAYGADGETWSVSVSSADPSAAQVLNSSGAAVAALKGGHSVLISQSERYPHTTIIRGLMAGAQTAWAGIADKEVRGDVEIAFNASSGTLTVINIVNLEEYAAGVLAAEMPVSYPAEALKAQAVLARTYALHSVGAHEGRGYDICDEQHCQVYAGVKVESPAALAAVAATKGEVLASGGKPISAFFFSNCGGFTQDGTMSGWGPFAYLQSVSDYLEMPSPPATPYGFAQMFQYPAEAYCGSALPPSDPQFRWTRYVSEPDLRLRVTKIKDIGRIKAVVPVKRSLSGHTGRLLVRGETGEIYVDNDYPIRKLLGMSSLRSSAFVVETAYGEDNLPEAFLFYGGGWGHGVGFCQTGAKGHAESGDTYREMLSHYYPGAVLEDAAKHQVKSPAKPAAHRIKK
ncbi:MAG: SpoIID/LytB domain-containing protein [Elusimicrobiales bacterium]|nr:SpoIID/LytB domain-containing protein [Elusimicrobiales bacterium]